MTQYRFFVNSVHFISSAILSKAREAHLARTKEITLTFKTARKALEQAGDCPEYKNQALALLRSNRTRRGKII